MSNLERAKEALGLYNRAYDLGWLPKEADILPLVKDGVDVHAMGGDDWTLLHWAAWYGHIEVCKLLIQQGTNIDARDKDANPSLHLAARHKKTEIVKYLVDRGADIHARDKDGNTPLLWLALHVCLDVCALLLEKGADIHAPDNKNNTPLHVAARNGHTETVKLLLGRGANIWAVNAVNGTVLGSDFTNFIKPHLDHWQPILEAVLNKNCNAIKTTQDLYHLASVMIPENPKDIPEPKEFIRELFARYLPHNEHLNTLYSTIFNKSRGHETLAGVRDSARKEQRGVV